MKCCIQLSGNFTHNLVVGGASWASKAHNRDVFFLVIMSLSHSRGNPSLYFFERSFGNFRELLWLRGAVTSEDSGSVSSSTLRFTCRHTVFCFKDFILLPHMVSHERHKLKRDLYVLTVLLTHAINMSGVKPSFQTYLDSTQSYVMSWCLSILSLIIFSSEYLVGTGSDWGSMSMRFLLH